MKGFLVLLALLTAGETYAAFKTHHLSLGWGDEAGAQVLAFDQDRIEVTFPRYTWIRPFVEVESENLVTEGSCNPISIVAKEKKVVITFELKMTGPDDGFNGCKVLIYSGHPDHEDGHGIVPLTFGLSIDD